MKEDLSHLPSGRVVFAAAGLVVLFVWVMVWLIIDSNDQYYKENCLQSHDTVDCHLNKAKKAAIKADYENKLIKEVE